jgi:aminoglycoside phosphotransferase (APT) family kinase protein
LSNLLPSADTVPDRNTAPKEPISVHIPDPVELTSAALHAICERHGLNVSGFSPMPAVGITNTQFALGDCLVLRLPRNHPGIFAVTLREAAAVPTARLAGVRTPRIVAFDNSRALVEAPYTIYERAQGETLGLLGLEPHQTTDAYRGLGADMARLHHGVTGEQIDPGQKCSLTPGDPPSAHRLAELGYFSAVEARWLDGWFGRLLPAVRAPVPQRFLHGDMQTTNVIVESGSFAYEALLDWGNAGWGDPALDFVGLPMRAVPFVLDGYRKVASDTDAGCLETRILAYQLWFALLVLSRPPQPSLSWAERPLGMLLETLRFFLKCPDSPWDGLHP